MREMCVRGNFVNSIFRARETVRIKKKIPTKVKFNGERAKENKSLLPFLYFFKSELSRERFRATSVAIKNQPIRKIRPSYSRYALPAENSNKLQRALPCKTTLVREETYLKRDRVRFTLRIRRRRAG